MKDEKILDRKGETQTLHLQKMMQRHKVYPEYTLTLPLFSMKKKALKKLERGEVLLLGLDFLDLMFVKEGKMYAKAVQENVGKSVKIEITSVEETSMDPDDNKKYETVLATLSKVQCRVLEVGHKVEVSMEELTEVDLFLMFEEPQSQKFARGTLVTVDDEIAIEITEVYAKVYHGKY
jgi:hypothetical protein